MKKILILTLFFIFKLHAEEFIIYPKFNQADELRVFLDSNKISYTSTLTHKEKSFMNFSYEVKNSIKVTIDPMDIETFYKNPLLRTYTYKIEKNKKIQMYSEPYEKWQWGLNNSGEDVEIKISDIESIFISSKLGEDISLSHILENQNRRIRVAVIDSGIDLNHPDLKNKIYFSAKECEKLNEYNQCLNENSNAKNCHEKYAHLDMDQNGYPLDCHGWNVAAPINEYTKIQGNNNVQDLIGHGTFVSGIIAAEINNNEGIRGIINNVEILPVKVSGSDEEAEEDNATDIFAKGILYALQNNVDIINLSVGWASDEDSLLVTEIIKKAHEMGIVVVVAAGNSGHSSITYPCSYNEVICVAAHNPNGELSQFSNRGSSVDIIAPGRKILSTWPLELHPKLFTNRHGYEFKDGTSFSAPFVVGAIAKLLNLGFSATEAKVKLLSSTRKKYSNTPFILNGNLDLNEAIKKKATSFIYPYKKTPALINWNAQNKKIIIKLKNYLKDTRNIKLSLETKIKHLMVLNPNYEVDNWSENEIKEFEFQLNGPNEIESDLIFTLSIKTDQENKEYPIQAVAMTLISENFKREDTITRNLESNIQIQNMTIHPFENINPYKEQDFLVVDSSGKKVKFHLMKLIKDNYRISPAFESDLDKPYISHLSRIDLDQDGNVEYVIFGFLKIKGTTEDTWLTKFYVFDSKFRKIDYKIAPNNEFDNKLTTISDHILWLKIKNKIVPTWISTGFTPKEDLTPLNPWRAPILNSYKKNIYYLTDERLHTISVGDQLNPKEPHTFFQQSHEERLNFTARYLSYDSGSFKKNYYIEQINSLNPIWLYQYNYFHDVANLEIDQTLNDNELLLSDSDNFFRHRLSVFSKIDNQVEQFILKSDDVFDPIQTIFAKDEHQVFYGLSKYKLLFIKDEMIFSTESRNTDMRIQYFPIKNKTALYIPSQHTPAFSSEVISFNHDLKTIERTSQYRTIPYGSCQEIGLGSSFWSDVDSIIYYCDSNKVFHFIKL